MNRMDKDQKYEICNRCAKTKNDKYCEEDCAAMMILEGIFAVTLNVVNEFTEE